MAEKMIVEKVSVEMDVLWGRLKELEMTLSRKLETTLKSTARKLKQQLSGSGDELIISNELRHEIIQLTAYHKAEARGFVGGDMVQDWLEAELQVDLWLLERENLPMDIEVVALSDITTDTTDKAGSRLPGAT